MSQDGSPDRLPDGDVPAEKVGFGLASRLLSGWRAMLQDLALAPLWGVVMALVALGYLTLHGRVGTGQTGMILALFAAGGTLSFPFSVFLSKVLSNGRRAETRFASAFLCLTLLTIGVTALLFALQYRLFFSRWHAPFATRIWVFQFAFTSASALYQFIVMGVRLYMPFGLPALLAMSLWLARTAPLTSTRPPVPR